VVAKPFGLHPSIAGKHRGDQAPIASRGRR